MLKDRGRGIYLICPHFEYSMLVCGILVGASPPNALPLADSKHLLHHKVSQNMPKQLLHHRFSQNMPKHLLHHRVSQNMPKHLLHHRVSKIETVRAPPKSHQHKLRSAEVSLHTSPPILSPDFSFRPTQLFDIGVAFGLYANA
jgi:hypothetical protein